ncbi:MAG TPA: hypothetical protein VLB68_29130 [Pyrinomonadaceae bacterium]|nr:hypothetical protein [Pyrinomonadaceae bacterium]
MGASIVVYWPGITEEQLDAQPSFWQDDRAWANFMAELDSATATVQAIQMLQADEILTYKTDGVEDEDVVWVTPIALRRAAERLREAVEKGLSGSELILKTYEIGANKVASLTEEFIRDIDDIIEMTKWAEGEGTSRMTLEVNW